MRCCGTVVRGRTDGLGWVGIANAVDEWMMAGCEGHGSHLFSFCIS